MINQTSDTGYAAGSALAIEISYEGESASASRAHLRSMAHLAKLPHAKLRAVIVHRIQNPRGVSRDASGSLVLPNAPTRASVRKSKGRKVLSAFEREDAHALVAMACERLRIEDGSFPSTRDQWKTIFRMVRSGLGIDRKTKRDERVEIISLDPYLLSQVEVADIFTAPDSEEADIARERLAPMVRVLIKRVLAAYSVHDSRKRASRKKKALSIIKNICAVRLGRIEDVRPISNGNSPDAVSKAFHDFKAYLAMGEAEIMRRESTLRAGEFKSLSGLLTLAE